MLKDNKKVPVKIHENAVVEHYAVDWKSSKTWLIIGGIVLLVILLILLIVYMSKHHAAKY